MLDLDLDGGASAKVRIDAIAVDPKTPQGDVFLYDLSVSDAAGGWAPVCAPEADGKPHAILRPAPQGRIAILCTAGALGKCIRFGYRPWATAGGRSLEPYWQACARMVRADYCGDEQPTTRDGMLIDLWDEAGVQERAGAEGLSFEAAWAAEGALCVAHPRVPQNVTLETLEKACPRLSGRLGPACTPDAARRWGSPLLFNDSRGDGLPETGRR